MKDVLVVCPQERDVQAVRSAGLEDRYRVTYAGADLDLVDEFDPAAFLREWEGVPADGVVATKDRSALLAALLAQRRGLPGPTPAALLACQHKPTAREIQQRTAPEATPRYALLDAHNPPFEYPFFAKPVIGRLSQGAARVDSEADLRTLQENEQYTRRYAEIAALAGADIASMRGFLAEELLTGDEVTLEGYVHGGRVTTVGVTDSVKYAGTGSFERFEYPSKLSEERQAELSVIAERVLPGFGFDCGFFNVEYFVPPTGPPGLVEVNGRIASQFAPLVQELHGRSTYDALFQLACGEDPRWKTGLPDGVGISYCIRVFEDAFVEAVPEPEEGLEILVAPGLRLSEQGTNDAQSYRLAIFSEFGETREEAVARCHARARRLNFRLQATAPVR
jgi:biotin carboxylase